MKNIFKQIALALAFLSALAVSGLAATTTQTTLSAAVTSTSGNTTTISVTSATGFTASTQTQEYDAYVDGEMMKIQAVNGTAITVTRGYRGSPAILHASGAVIYAGLAGAGGPFINQDPVAGATCTASQYPYLPLVNWQRLGPENGAATGRIWNCIGSQWMRDDGLVTLSPANCVSSVSGNGTGTNGLTTAGASVTPVMQAQTSATGTNTHTYVCNLSAVFSRLNLRGILVKDAVFLYGVQTTALGTQVATLASGTMNSAIVFSSITYPAAGASETASTVTPVRADAGTLLITPVVASFNTATTTAGGFYSATFTPATPFAVTTDLKQYLLTVALLNTATSATVTNSPGVVVHYAYLPD